ncbi:MAG: DNA mismatch repair endonuclease MutL [Anaerolineales bacterium]|nr:DNA mismatch repair endonuclease MutL [Anaerolineales bacterium]
MPIRVLAEAVASQIAAGEVVERPASVVKELVENALDAGARSVTITVEGGGRALVRVADDGQGIPAAEVELAFARHATSKLTSAEDLTHVQTLGFRGEALASIASVSRLGLLTRAAPEDLGTQLRLEGGSVVQRGPIGAPQGTVISVENLFYNVPARLKFLKSETAERSSVAQLVSRYAIAYPAVRFRLVFDNRTNFQSSGSGDAREALAAAYGADIARQLLELGSVYDAPPASAAPPDTDDDGLFLHERRARDAIGVMGFISPPALNRSNRKDITLFVNGRWVHDIRLSTAVLQAYHTMLMVGRYPIAIVMLAVPAEDVDVNVHPTKAEIRFRYPDAAFTAVERAVRKTLTAQAPVPHFAPRQWSLGGLERGGAGWSPEWGRFAGEASSGPAEAGSGEGPAAGAAEAFPAGRPLPAASVPAQAPLSGSEVPLLRVIGQVGAAYIVAEGPDGLYLIDQHAAHERVLYEAYRLQRAAAQVVSQALLEPVAVDVPAEAAALLERQLEALQRIGFRLEPFGGNTFLVRSLPTVLGRVDPARAVRVVVEDFEEDETLLAAEVEARLIARVCKRAAVKAGQVLSPAEQAELVRQLEKCVSPRTCPHGRPTMIHLSVDAVERQFGRKG